MAIFGNSLHEQEDRELPCLLMRLIRGPFAECFASAAVTARKVETHCMLDAPVRTGTLTFDLHPLYASILKDGSTVRKDEVLGLDGDLRRALIAPFDGVIRLLTTGEGEDRRVRVYLTEAALSRRR